MSGTEEGGGEKEMEGEHSLLTLLGNETLQRADRIAHGQPVTERAKEDSGRKRNKNDKG